MYKSMLFLSLFIITFPFLCFSDNTKIPSKDSKDIVSKEGDIMIFIPAGEFTMGNDAKSTNKINEKYKTAKSLKKNLHEDVSPEHSVYVDGFYIDKYEVTNAQFEEFTKMTNRRVPGFLKVDYFNNPKQPVVGVTYDDAAAYAEWAGKRLPTEAEWEKAARGTDKRVYPWGNDIYENSANFIQSKLNHPAVVGSYKEDISPYGVMDMGGNVSEWVSDWYQKEYYADSPSKNPAGPKEGEGNARVYRGGNYRSKPSSCRTYTRNFTTPDSETPEIGFRCVSNAKIEIEIKKETPKKVSVSEKELQNSQYNVNSSFTYDFERLFKNGEQIPFEYKEKKQDYTTNYNQYGASSYDYNSYNASIKGYANVINLSDSDITICILNSADQVCFYNEIIAKQSSRSFNLTGFSNYRTYVKYLDDFNTIYRAGSFNIDPDTDYRTTLIFDVDGRYAESSKPDKTPKQEGVVEKQLFKTQKGEYQPDFNSVYFLNKTIKPVDVSIVDKGTMVIVEKFSLPSMTYYKKRLSNGEYNTLVKYANIAERVFDGQSFTVNSFNRHITIAYSDKFGESSPGGNVESTVENPGVVYGEGYIYTRIWIYR